MLPNAVTLTWTSLGLAASMCARVMPCVGEPRKSQILDQEGRSGKCRGVWLRTRRQQHQLRAERGHKARERTLGHCPQAQHTMSREWFHRPSPRRKAGNLIRGAVAGVPAARGQHQRRDLGGRQRRALRRHMPREGFVLARKPQHDGIVKPRLRQQQLSWIAEATRSQRGRVTLAADSREWLLRAGLDPRPKTRKTVLVQLAAHLPARGGYRAMQALVRRRAAGQQHASRPCG